MNAEETPEGYAKDAAETVMLILPSFFYMLVAVLLTSMIPLKYKLVSFLTEFVIIVVPIILNVTVFSKYVTNFIFVSCCLLWVHLLLYSVYIYCKPKKELNIPKNKQSPKKDYITNIRATINLISVIAILAVDFKIFPSKYSKTKTTGFSLMDVGVGLYVFANGIVAPEVKGKVDSIKSSIKGSALLLIIGIARLVLTKVTHYKVSESEYGVHWNFFITLAFTKIFSSCILNLVNVKYIIFNAILLVCAHETLLQVYLKKWVFYSEKRSDFLSANKEGIVSTVGYVCLYLFSLYFGYRTKQTERRKTQTNILFFLSTILALILTYFCTTKFDISRRIANSAYVFWVLFIGILMMWLFYLAENFGKQMFKDRMPNFICAPYIYEAINYNGLIFFLLGNVITGLINLSISTKKVGSLLALFIISMYMVVNCGCVFMLYLKQWRLKF